MQQIDLSQNGEAEEIAFKNGRFAVQAENGLQPFEIAWNATGALLGNTFKITDLELPDFLEPNYFHGKQNFGAILERSVSKQLSADQAYFVFAMRQPGDTLAARFKHARLKVVALFEREIKKEIVGRLPEGREITLKYAFKNGDGGKNANHNEQTVWADVVDCRIAAGVVLGFVGIGLGAPIGIVMATSEHPLNPTVEAGLNEITILAGVPKPAAVLTPGMIIPKGVTLPEKPRALLYNTFTKDEWLIFAEHDPEYVFAHLEMVGKAPYAMDVFGKLVSTDPDYFFDRIKIFAYRQPEALLKLIQADLPLELVVKFYDRYRTYVEYSDQILQDRLNSANDTKLALALPYLFDHHNGLKQIQDIFKKRASVPREIIQSYVNIKIKCPLVAERFFELALFSLFEHDMNAIEWALDVLWVYEDAGTYRRSNHEKIYKYLKLHYPKYTYAEKWGQFPQKKLK